MTRNLVLVLLLALTGCEQDNPVPHVIPITDSGKPEAVSYLEVHVLHTKHHEGESWGRPVQEALVAWISSNQHLDVIDFEGIGPDGNSDVVVLARRRHN